MSFFIVYYQYNNNHIIIYLFSYLDFDTSLLKKKNFELVIGNYTKNNFTLSLIIIINGNWLGYFYLLGYLKKKKT